MKFEDYIQGISFKLLQPERKQKWFRNLSKLFNLLDISLEVWNTSLPEDAQGMQERFADLMRIPRMSTFANAVIINKAVSGIAEGESFVNVGVWNGFTLFAGMAGNSDKTCIGIDDFSQFGGPRGAFLERFDRLKSPSHRFFDLDYRDYFRTRHEGKIGVYLYDAKHSYDNQLLGLEIAEPHFSKDCLIIVDDANDEKARSATLDFIQDSSHDYQILLDRITRENRHPTFWNGIIVARRVR